MKEPQMEQIAAWIEAVVGDTDNAKTLDRVRAEVLELTAQYPVP